MNGFNIAMIGDRINPGFKPTRTLIENHDIAGLQALAVRQVESGASYLDLTIGPRAFSDHGYLAEAICAVQEAVAVPPSLTTVNSLNLIQRHESNSDARSRVNCPASTSAPRRRGRNPDGEDAAGTTKGCARRATRGRTRPRSTGRASGTTTGA